VYNICRFIRAETLRRSRMIFYYADTCGKVGFIMILL
jgi:hypothetical protein